MEADTMEANTASPGDELLSRLKMAVAVANDAEGKVTTAQSELVSRSKAVGVLLLEAKKMHPRVGAFEAFLKRVDGLKLSRAYDMMRLAGGRTTEEDLKKDARERQQKSRDKKKIPKPEAKPESKPEPAPDSVTSRKDDTQAVKGNASAASARALADFTYACRTYLPRMTEKDRQKAYEAFVTYTKARAA